MSSLNVGQFLLTSIRLLVKKTEGTTQLRLTQFEMHPCLCYRVP